MAWFWWIEARLIGLDDYVLDGVVQPCLDYVSDTIDCLHVARVLYYLSPLLLTLVVMLQAQVRVTALNMMVLTTMILVSLVLIASVEVMIMLLRGMAPYNPLRQTLRSCRIGGLITMPTLCLSPLAMPDDPTIWLLTAAVWCLFVGNYVISCQRPPPRRLREPKGVWAPQPT